MKAVYFEKFNGPVTIETVKDPSPSEDGVVIEVKASGLCLSDWHGYVSHDPDIQLPHVPGHELAGVISEVGKNIKNFNVGDRVTMPFVCGCGHCPQCDHGNHHICDHQFQPGFTAWGSFAKFVAVDYADINLVKLPESIDFITAASLGCRFVTSYRGIVAQGQIKEDQWVAVHGCGGVGLSAIMIAKAKGANVIAIDIDDNKLDFAKQIGADILINSKKEDNVIESVRDQSGGGAHISVDALGHQDTSFNSISNLRKQGKHIQIGLMTGDHHHPRIPMDRVIADELQIIGSHGMQAHKYPEMLNLIQSGLLNPDKLIGQTISLEQAAIELPKMNEYSGEGIKVISLQ